MRRRLFLLALVAVILLVQATLRTAFMATPFSGGETLGGLSFWELRGAIPLGVFAAGLLLVTTAAASIIARAAIQLTGGHAGLRDRLSALSTASLWCGIPAMAGCFNVLPYIFPWLIGANSSSWQTQQHLDWVLHGSLILLVVCHVAGQATRKSAPVVLPIALLCLLALGQIGFSMAFILMPASIMTAAGMLMFHGKGRRWATIPLLTGIGMNGALLWLTANAAATIPAAGAVYAATLLLLSIPFCLKIYENQV